MSTLRTPYRPRRSAPRNIWRRAFPRVLLLLTTGAATAVGCTGGEAPSGDSGAVQAAEAPVQPSPRPGTAWVIFDPDTVVAEVAATPEARERGLMYRDEVPDGTGMLFVFEREEIRSFWMQNTYIDLDIAFIDAGFRIVDIQTMEAETTEFYEGAAPALYALEVRAGWFADRGIEVGDVAEIRFGG